MRSRHSVCVEGDFVGWSPHGTRVGWSPDGSRVAYVKGTAYGQLKLRTASADGSSDTRVAVGVSSLRGIEWSPDGTRIADLSGPASDRLELWTAGADGSTPTRISGAPGSIGWTSRGGWSPDGTRFAYYLERGINTTSGVPIRELWTVSLDGSNPIRFADDGRWGGWSP